MGNLDLTHLKVEPELHYSSLQGPSLSKNR